MILQVQVNSFVLFYKKDTNSINSLQVKFWWNETYALLFKNSWLKML